ncbi:MAG: hypothetical protein C4576_34615 [Desulfobacteraceae bacterium]|nr:MAG: hypothetical protein C4576_34615 [Desulfobacteraceae bacterium]
MSFKEDLKAKIHLDKLLHKTIHSLREPPGAKRVDKGLVREILAMTDFEYRSAANLHLYVRPMEDGIMEILLLDNELPIYHTTVEDVMLRKSPHWQDVFSIRNIKRIMYDQDIIVSRGKESLKRLHAAAIERLDLAYTRADLDLLAEEARMGFEKGSLAQIRESLDLFFELLGIQPVYFGLLEQGMEIFGRPVTGRGSSLSFEHLVILNEQTLSVELKRGVFSPETFQDWFARYAQKQARPDLSGMEVFEFLADLALERVPHYAKPPADASESREGLHSTLNESV